MPKTKPARKLSYNALTGTLHITQGAKEWGYYVDRIDSEIGPAYRLTKIIPPAAGPDHYDVRPEAWTCECLGHYRHGLRTVCKHVAALRCLRSRGSLS